MKTSNIFYYSIFILTVGLTNTLSPQELIWNHLGGPMGGTIGDIAINSKGYIFAGVYGDILFDSYYEGLYKSTDNGETWNKVETQFDLQIYAVYITKEDHIFIGTDFQDRIYRSTDEGNTWEISSSGFGSNQCWSFGENKDGTVLFAGSGGLPTISRSTNNGNNWQNVAQLSAISFAADSLNNIYCGTFDGVYKSIDNGITWDSTGLDNFSVNSILTDKNNGVICGTGYYSGGNGVYYSTDFGDSWTNIGLHWEIVLSLAFTSYGSLLVGTASGNVYETTDMGIHWLQHNNGLYKKQAFRLKVNESDDIFVGSEIEGIFRSTNKGGSFEQVGLPISRVNNIVFSGDSLIVSATPSGVQKYNRITGEWKNIGLHRVNAVETDEEGNIYAGTNGEGLYLSSDFGKSWININSYPIILNVKQVNQKILVATDTGLIRSTNYGSNWEDTPVQSGIDNCAIEINDNGDVWAVGYVGKLYKSTDEGLTFDSTELNFIYVDRNNLFVNDSLIFFGDYAAENGMFYSLDYGNNWEHRYQYRNFNSINGKGEYIISSSNDIFFSANKGLSWDSIPYPSDFNGGVLEIEYDKNGQLFFGTSSQGLYEMDFIVNVNEEDPSANNFIFYPLYPNPFNSTIKIKYNLPVDCEIKITLYNMLGEKIKSSDMFRRKGINEERMSFNNLSGGIYLIAIEGKNFYVVKKAAYLK